MIAPANLSRITIPPLENGDLLTRAEFERRYTAMPALKKAELIEGIVYMASPLRFEPHAEPHADLMGWLWTYKIATPGVRLGDNPTVRLDVDNEPQPDAVLLIDAQRGGQTCLSDDGSTATIDLRDKKRVYRRSKVKEYLVWQVTDRRIDWFSLQEEEYISLVPDAAGIIRSRVFPGLWLAVSALLDGDMPSALATLQTGLNSDAHQEFVQQLATFPNPA
ncbi:MAG: Uma2 family endonuclease [Microcoleus sp. PH2017_17_BER_D_A]|nr:Uma2 family endonuclease [Microcoleus sp. PH2017_17_BER_D_A]